MDYNKQVQEISNYFKSNEKTVDNFKIGVELEHFVIDKDTLKTISYYGENGVAETLKELESIGYNATYEGQYILGLNKGKKYITLEPGSQFELSIDASINIKELEDEYLDFMNDIIPILEKKNQGLMATGYHPVTKINEIKLLPKKRYDYMFNYFKTRGTHAHNMMKGTAALQVSLDFSSEEDYKRKFRVTNALSPVLYTLFENAYYFENEESDTHNIRAHIWKNCDTDRSGIVEGALDEDFGYSKYAEYILNRPPIFIYEDGNEVYTGNQKVRELFNPDNYKVEDLEHLLTMFFPDVRTKKYVEIRMMDSIPYNLNFSVIALLKGLIYDEGNLETLYNYTKSLTIEDVENAKEEMMDKGLEANLKDESLLNIGKYLVELAKKGLSDDEIHYLNPLEQMLESGKNPYEITKENSKYGKKEALQWCLLNKRW
ncbi:MAG: glutamate-cysteine ligase family protein [Tissierellaceae bacterium]|nr:glutamate-cysteine ligase family protein [Tissierellaceae bacterium]